MDISTISLLISIGGIVASVASAQAVVKTKVSQMEKIIASYETRIEGMKETIGRQQSDDAVKLALLESKQESFARELAEVKSDTKTIMSDVQEIKEAILIVKKGAK